MAGSSSAGNGIIKGAYWPEWAADYFPPSFIDTGLFTHLYYAFLVPDDGTKNLLVSDPSPTASKLRSFTSTIHHKNPPAAKTLLSVGGWDAGGEVFSQMASVKESRKSFIESCINVARKYGFDGIDLDWEFPQNPQDMENLGELLEEWRAKVNGEAQETGHTKLLLSAAVPSEVTINNNPDERRSFPVKSINENLDWVNVMCYDYCGSWTPTVTGAHAAWSNPHGLSTRSAIDTWIKAGLDRSKFVMGLPLYGHTWTLQDPGSNGVGAPALCAGVGPEKKETMTYSEVVAFNRNKNATVVYDPSSVSSYSYVGIEWVGYDDVTSTTEKIKHAKDIFGIRGYFFWEVAGDHEWEISSAASNLWT